MALFVFGSDGETLGRLGDLECSVCKAKRPFGAAARYSYFLVGMFGVAGLVRYFITCAACDTTWPLDRKQAKAFKREGLLVPPDIPPLRKFGLLAALILFGSIILLSKYGPLVTAVVVLAVLAVLFLPGVMKGVRGKGFKAYTRDAVSADKPVSLFESVGGLPAARAPKSAGFIKCPTCGLNNPTGEAHCERCGASLVPAAQYVQ